MNEEMIRRLLEQKFRQYNRSDFIPNDPISIPHQFKKPADIEIAGFFAAIFAWGNRKTILNKSRELLTLMDDAPFQFISQLQEKDLKKFRSFKHRTFQNTDLIYFIDFLQQHYQQYPSLETAFTLRTEFMEDRLNAFQEYFFSLPSAPTRTRKHITAPKKGSTCKRLNMFLRWMVRKDKNQVDFGIWKLIKPSELICPLDVHVSRVARKLGLISRKQTDWLTAIELTESLKGFDPNDPVKYDFALFSLGVNEKY